MKKTAFILLSLSFSVFASEPSVYQKCTHDRQYLINYFKKNPNGFIIGKKDCDLGMLMHGIDPWFAASQTDLDSTTNGICGVEGSRCARMNGSTLTNGHCWIAWRAGNPKNLCIHGAWNMDPGK